MRKSIFVGMVALLAVSGLAQAAVIINDNFDSYADDAAFKAVWNDSANPTPYLDPGYGVGGTNGVYVNGGVVVQQNFAQQNLSDTQIIVLEADYWNFDAPSGRNTVGVRGNNSGTSGMFEIGEYNALSNGGTTNVAAFGMRAHYLGAPTGSGGTWWNITPANVQNPSADPLYNHFKMEIAQTWVKGTVTLSDGTVYTRTLTLTLGAGKFVDQVRMGGPSGISSGGIGDFDNVKVYTVPEPASMLLLGLGGLLLRRRRA